MNDFQYYTPTKVVFGRGTEEQAGQLVKEQGGTRALVHFGGRSARESGLLDRVLASLDRAGVAHVELGGVVPNPRLSKVREGMELCRREGVDFLLAVGGGSVIDSAKAIALGLAYEGDVWDLFSGQPAQDCLPVGTVLTIAAAGSEMSNSCVITNEDGNYKRYIGGECLIPKFAFMNPEVTFTMPPHQIANGCSDIVAHLMERYFTRVKHVDFTDRLIEGAIRTILYHGPMALENPTDYDVRAEIMWAGTVAHNNLLNTGRIGDWASHDIEHELSAQYDIAHGAGLSIVFPAWMKYVYKTDIDKFVQFAVRVFDVSLAFDDPEKIVFEMIARLESWYRKMGLPTRLSDVGIGEEHLREMAEKCLAERDGRNGLGNFRALHVEDIYRIYKLAL